MNKFFKCFFISIICIVSLTFFYSCDSEDQNNNVDIPEAIPNELTYYEIDIEGSTWVGFSRKGCLYITESVDNAANFNNGINKREVGLVSGFPAVNSGAGAMWFFTNTNLCQYGSTSCNSTIRDAALDVAFVTVNENSRTIDIELDGQLYNNTGAGAILTSNYINHFRALSSLTSNVYRTITGNIKIKFSEDSDNISGTINITGNNFSGTGTAPYTASFTGKKVFISANSCR